MPIMRGFRPLSVVVFVLTVSALVGGIFGSRALAVDEKIPEHNKTFSAALSAIEANYVEDVESDLERNWTSARNDSRLEWNEAKGAVRDGWHHIERAMPGDLDRDGR